jgi:hypothetical protein
VDETKRPERSASRAFTRIEWRNTRVFHRLSLHRGADHSFEPSLRGERLLILRSESTFYSPEASRSYSREASFLSADDFSFSRSELLFFSRKREYFSHSNLIETLSSRRTLPSSTR